MLKRSIVQAMLALGLAGCCFGGSGIPGLPGTGTPGTPPGVGTTGTAPPTTPPPGVGGGLVTIGPGFLPDPSTAAGTAGGPVAASTMSPDCRGFIAAQPNHILNATGQFANLRIVVSSPSDTTLVVQRADGSFACNDDSDGLNPVVAGPFGPGQHRVWVGTYSATASGAAYTIGFTELSTVTAASLGGGGVVPGIGAIPGVAGAMGALVPQDCGMAVPVYGPVAVGSSVVLGMHTPWTGSDGQGGVVTADTNWAADMAQYVGQRTTVTQLSGLDTAGCPGIRVQADNGTFFWRLRNVSF
ncbi:hypothetical protein [Sandaracinus amylolyticus]|uniref:hypothetical protein n=1 Tax=Sandaracinus amylolyticus TaxID=927083 RepID=UPI001F31151D|nr:hypothetical protein [Sandaracinus amylolyticus]UJR79741.1 PPC domain-containing protein [Sandaracinus amylolyticus]